jgi:hypothetical protein
LQKDAVVTLDPWIIEQQEEEERRRREDDEARRSRIELPLTSPAEPSTETREPTTRVRIVPLSPEGDATFEL